MCATRRHFLACEGVAGGSQHSGGNHFFHETRWSVWWVHVVRWRNHYFARNKEALPCYGLGPSCQPLHVQSSPFVSRSLSTPCRENHDGGRRRGLGRGRRGAREDAAVDAHAERSMRVHSFGCGVRLPSPQGLANGGNSRGTVRPVRQHSRLREAGAGSPTIAGLGGWSKKTRGCRSTTAVG